MRRVSVVIAVIAFTVLGPRAYAPPALFTFSDLHVHSHSKTVRIPPRHGRHVLVSCLEGQELLTGGAFFHLRGHGPTPKLGTAAHLIDSFPASTKTKGRWAADGFNMTLHRTIQMTVVVRCTAKAITANRGAGGAFIDPGNTTEGDSSCSSGVIHTGGTELHRDASNESLDPLGADVYTSSSVAQNPPDEWLATYANESTIRVDYSTHQDCTNALASYAPTVLKTFDETGKGVGGRASCPVGTRIITGGAFFNQRSAGLNAADADRAALASSGPTKDNKGWYADGFAAEAGADDFQLTVEAICLPV